jgi:hypothetical protein
MLRRAVLSIRLLLVVLGCGVLSASIWGQVSRSPGHACLGMCDGAPSGHDLELWQTSATCARPFFIKAVLRIKARLKASYAAAPPDLQAALSRPSAIGATESAGTYRVADVVANERQRAIAEGDSMLHARYAEWYATVSALEIQQSRWEERLLKVSDQKVLLDGSARKNFKAHDTGSAGAPSAKGDFEHYVLYLLGLGGFADDEELAIRADCLTVVPAASVSALSPVWPWPVEHVAASAFGLELVLLGALLVPIALWIKSGDLSMVRKHVRDEAKRVVMVWRVFDGRTFLADLSGKVVAIGIAGRRLLDVTTSRAVKNR